MDFNPNGSSLVKIRGRSHEFSDVNVQKVIMNSALRSSAAIPDLRYDFLNSEALRRPENVALHQTNF